MSDIAGSTELAGPWTLIRSGPGEYAGPQGLTGGEIPAQVPGTAAGALQAAGRWQPGDECDFDAHDWWFRTSFLADRAAPGEQVVLALDGVATVAEIYLNGEPVLTSESMFAAHRLDVGDVLRGDNQLAICCRALAPRLAERRRPRARWRTRLVSHGNLRFFRTMLIGRAPGFAAGPAVVGPWRPIRLERTRGLTLSARRLRTRVLDGRGELEVSINLSGSVPAVDAAIELRRGGTCQLEPLTAEGGHIHGTVSVPDVALWWPHTHGEPALYETTLVLTDDAETQRLPLGATGFRELQAGPDLEREGVQLRVNDVRVFARGAVWTPLSMTAPHSRGPELRRVLERVRAAGMNMLRVPGIGCYESPDFYDLCDELGILIWQDFMFANLDYPEADVAFMATVAAEAEQVLEQLGGRPSLALLCGGSEVAQQVAMLGLDPALASGPLYGELLPAAVAAADVQAPYVASTPWGGDLPFRTDRGVANYYGVGAYLRPLEDARRAQVKFAAECLAFSNVPDASGLQDVHAPGGLTPHHPAWKAGVPRDAGAGWDFQDVSEHYLKLVYGLDPVALRSVDIERYLDLARLVTGEVMSEVFGEWRRSDSGCGGGLVLWLKDLQPGAGWGVLDHRGAPKAAYHLLRRALAPVAVWTVDEGLGGIAIHVANDRPEPLQAWLRVALYRDFEVLSDEVSIQISVGAHRACEHNVEQLVGRFVDAAWSYRFGPPAQNLIVVSLERREEDTLLLSQSMRMPAGPPSEPEPVDRLGLTAAIEQSSPDRAILSLQAARLVHGVRVQFAGWEPDDDAFALEPGHERRVALHRAGAEIAPAATITALNLRGRLAVAASEAGR